eukprot:5466424-Prymnesium_polylepis.3
MAGTAGLGKSTTAAVFAYDMHVQSAFPGGLFWLRFGQERTALDVLRELAGMLGIDTSIIREQQGAVIDAIAERLQGQHCLLILDDVWTYAQAQPFVQLRAGGRLLTTQVCATWPSGHVSRCRRWRHWSERRRCACSPPACRRTPTSRPMMTLRARAAERRDPGCSSSGVRSARTNPSLRLLPSCDKRAARTDASRSRRRQITSTTPSLRASRCSSAALRRAAASLHCGREDAEMPLCVAATLWGVDQLEAAAMARKLEGQSLVKRTEVGTASGTEASASDSEAPCRRVTTRCRSPFSTCTCSTCGTARATRSRVGTQRL